MFSILKRNLGNSVEKQPENFQLTQLARYTRMFGNDGATQLAAASKNYVFRYPPWTLARIGLRDTTKRPIERAVIGWKKDEVVMRDGVEYRNAPSLEEKDSIAQASTRLRRVVRRAYLWECARFPTAILLLRDVTTWPTSEHSTCKGRRPCSPLAPFCLEML